MQTNAGSRYECGQRGFGPSQLVKKVEVQEALPPAGALGAEPLSLVPKHFSREPAKRCSRALAANQRFFDSLKLACGDLFRQKLLRPDPLCGAGREGLRPL